MQYLLRNPIALDFDRKDVDFLNEPNEGETGDLYDEGSGQRLEYPALPA